MSKIIGRLVNVGIGKETSRGTAAAIAYWIPKMDFSHDDKIQQVVNEQSMGIIENAIGADITQKYSEGEIKGRVVADSFGLFLLSAIGSVSSGAVGGQAGAYDHTFSTLQSGQHPSLTVGVKDANSGTGLSYALSMIDTLEINAELNKYLEMSVKYRGNVNASSTLTPSYSAQTQYFLPQHATVKFASNIAGLGAASAISVKRVNLAISKNLEDDQVLGTLTPADRLNKQFAVEGSIELMYDSRTYIDTNMLGDLAQALRIQFTNTGVTIGTSTNPDLKIDLASVKLKEVARSQSNDDFVTQTLNFTAFYSVADTSMISVVLRNTVASY